MAIDNANIDAINKGTNDREYLDLQQYLNTLTEGQKESLDYLTKRDENKRFWQNRKVLLDPLTTGYHYMFVTSPELPISYTSPSLIGGNPAAAKSALDYNRKALNIDGVSIYNDHIVNSLAGSENNFIPMLTNRSLSIVASDDVLNTIDYSETWNKYKIMLGNTAKDSRISGNFSINYAEDSALTIMKMHKLWMDYIEKAFMGECVSGGVLLGNDLMSNEKRTIDYVVSVYHFSTMPDGETLTHWCRYTGVFPIKTPWSEFTSEDSNAEIKRSIPIEYQFSYKEDMSVYVLRDFNLLQGSSNWLPNANLYTGGNVNLGSVAENKPRIIQQSNYVANTGEKRFKLLFPTVN